MASTYSDENNPDGQDQLTAIVSTFEIFKDKNLSMEDRISALNQYIELLHRSAKISDDLLLILLQDNQTLITLDPAYLLFLLSTLIPISAYIGPANLTTIRLSIFKLSELLLDGSKHKLPPNAVSKSLTYCVDLLGNVFRNQNSGYEIFAVGILNLWKKVLVLFKTIDDTENIELRVWKLQLENLKRMKENYSIQNHNILFKVTDAIFMTLIDNLNSVSILEKEYDLLTSLTEIIEMVKLHFGSQEVFQKFDQMIHRKIDEYHKRYQQRLSQIKMTKFRIQCAESRELEEKIFYGMVSIVNSYVDCHHELAAESALRIVQSPIFQNSLELNLKENRDESEMKFIINCLNLLSQENANIIWLAVEDTIIKPFRGELSDIRVSHYICIEVIARRLPKQYHKHGQIMAKALTKAIKLLYLRPEASELNPFKFWVASIFGHSMNFNYDLRKHAMSLNAWLQYMVSAPDAKREADNLEILLDFFLEDPYVFFQIEDSNLQNWMKLSEICWKNLHGLDLLKYPTLVEKTKKVLAEILHNPKLSIFHHSESHPEIMNSVKMLRDLEKDLTMKEEDQNRESLYIYRVKFDYPSIVHKVC